MAAVTLAAVLAASCSAPRRGLGAAPGPARAAAGGRRRLVGSRAAELRTGAARLHPADRRFGQLPLGRLQRPGLPAGPAGRGPARPMSRSSPSPACSAGTRASTCWCRSTRSRAPRWQTTTTQPGGGWVPSAADLYGVWFKAANKSLIWYNIGVFERAGIVPPASIDTLVPLEHAARQVGNARLRGRWRGRLDAGRLVLQPLPPHGWACPLRPAGRAPDPLDGSRRSTPPSACWPGCSPPGSSPAAPRRALATSYQRIRPGDLRPPSRRGHGVRGRLRGRGHQRPRPAPCPAWMPTLAPFPAAGRAGPMVVAGGDAAVLMRRSRRRGAALIRYLASPQAAAIWARARRLCVAEHQPRPVRLPRCDQQIDRAQPCSRRAATSGSACPI